MKKIIVSIFLLSFSLFSFGSANDLFMWECRGNAVFWPFFLENKVFLNCLNWWAWVWFADWIIDTQTNSSIEITEENIRTNPYIDYYKSWNPKRLPRVDTNNFDFSFDIAYKTCSSMNTDDRYFGDEDTYWLRDRCFFLDIKHNNRLIYTLPMSQVSHDKTMTIQTYATPNKSHLMIMIYHQSRWFESELVLDGSYVLLTPSFLEKNTDIRDILKRSDIDPARTKTTFHNNKTDENWTVPYQLEYQDISPSYTDTQEFTLSDRKYRRFLNTQWFEKYKEYISTKNTYDLRVAYEIFWYASEDLSYHQARYNKASTLSLLYGLRQQWKLELRTKPPYTTYDITPTSVTVQWVIDDLTILFENIPAWEKQKWIQKIKNDTDFDSVKSDVLFVDFMREHSIVNQASWNNWDNTTEEEDYVSETANDMTWDTDIDSVDNTEPEKRENIAIVVDADSSDTQDPSEQFDETQKEKAAWDTSQEKSEDNLLYYILWWVIIFLLGIIVQQKYFVKKER